MIQAGGRLKLGGDGVQVKHTDGKVVSGYELREEMSDKLTWPVCWNSCRDRGRRQWTGNTVVSGYFGECSVVHKSGIRSQFGRLGYAFDLLLAAIDARWAAFALQKVRLQHIE